MPLLTILLALATAGLLLPTTAHAGAILHAPTYVGLGSGLVGFWSFDGKDMAGVTSYDRSGNGNNGTLTNSPARTAGKIGQALRFDGVNDLVSVPDAATLSPAGEITISSWVDPGETISGTAEHVRGLIDSGAYSIFFDKSDGKLKFTLN
jgi:hypothetical protein